MPVLHYVMHVHAASMHPFMTTVVQRLGRRLFTSLYHSNSCTHTYSAREG